jgi:glycosyltransferase involved in cell wall biosynthesis
MKHAYGTGRSPTVTVIMATYNGSRHICASINSILSQTCQNLELIVVDDCSTDATASILASYTDPRLKLFRNETNLNVVASRNRCLAYATGQFVAMLDHDDLSAPTRLAKQIAYLEANPKTVLLGTTARILQDGQISEMNHPRVSTPGLIMWLLHVANPLICSSIMFRAAAARKLNIFMRDNYRYADDYDFYHRMAALGPIARLDEPLTIYRLHVGNTYKQQEETMAASAVKVLEPAYNDLFGPDAAEAARLVVRHLSLGEAVIDEASLYRLCHVFDTLNRLFLDNPNTDQATRDGLLRHSKVLWQRLLRVTARRGEIPMRAILAARPAGFSSTLGGRARLFVDRLPLRGRVRGAVHAFASSIQAVTSVDEAPAAPAVVHRWGTAYIPRPPDPLDPPTLFVSVDTEAEFDWDKPFNRGRTTVAAMDQIERGQDIFDRFGLRPIYVVDYPIASQARGYSRLRSILDRDGCEIGAHLHPWTTPPFEELVSDRNSYPGNLDPSLEDRKLQRLVEAIQASFGVSPLFYKAGRYGFGPSTPEALVRNGFKIDLSVLPGADLRKQGGPDFRQMKPVPYRLGETDILTVPMTRAPVGAIPLLGPAGQAIQATSGFGILRLPSVLARLRLADTITLTPEGVTADEQIRLLRALMKRGYRHFMLHYHSPSLSPGHTPYVRNQADADGLVSRLSTVCRFFFEDAGGLPGYPRDLLQVLQPATPDGSSFAVSVTGRGGVASQQTHFSR